MQWRSMKTARRNFGLKWFTIQWDNGERSVQMHDFVPYGAIAWAHIVDPTPYTGTLEELDMEGGDV